MFSFENTGFAAGEVEAVNDVLVLPARHGVEKLPSSSQPTGHSCTPPGDLAQVRAIQVDDEEIEDAHAAVEDNLRAVRRPDGVEVAVGGAGHRKVFTRGQVSDQDAAIDE